MSYNNSLSHLNKILINKRGYLFKMPTKGENVILLTSGGMDSICLWQLLLDKYKLNVYPLFIDFDSKGRSPLNSALYFGKIFKKKYKKNYKDIHILHNIPMFSFEKLGTPKNVIRDLNLVAHNMRYLKKQKKYISFMVNNPSRLGHYAFSAFDYSLHLKYEKGIKINTIMCGIVEEDSLIKESTLTTLRSLNVLLCEIIGNPHLQFTAPIEKRTEFYYSKIDLMKISASKMLPLEHTWSCHHDQFRHCGICYECYTRKQSFIDAHLKDKTIYSNRSYIIRPIRRVIRKIIQFLKSPKKNKRSDAIKLSNSSIISINRDTTASMINQSIHLLNSEDEFTVLNHTGSFILNKLIEGPQSLEDLSKLLHHKFKIDKDKAYSDTEGLIVSLVEDNFLEIN